MLLLRRAPDYSGNWPPCAARLVSPFHPLTAHLGALEARVIRHQVDGAYLEHLAQLDRGLPHRQIGRVLDDRVSRPERAVVFEKPVGGAQGPRACVVLEGQQLRGHLKEPVGRADRQRAPASDGRPPRVGQRHHPVLDLEAVLVRMHPREAPHRLCRLVGLVDSGERDVLGGGQDDADALAARRSRQPDLLPLVLGPVEGREVVEDGEGCLYPKQVFLCHTGGQPVDKHLAVAERVGQPEGRVDLEHLLGRAVPVEPQRRRRQRRERCGARPGGLNHAREVAGLGLAEQVLGGEKAVVADALLVPHPRLEPRRVRHREAALDHRRPVGGADTLLVLAHLLHLLEDVHAALAAARRPTLREVKCALAELLRELPLGSALRVRLGPVVHGAPLDVTQRVVRLLDLGPERGRAAAVGVVLHSLLLVRVAHRIRRRRGVQAQQLVVVHLAGHRSAENRATTRGRGKT
eukprot:scaffold23883_cov103-Isochrysis_galbana.AAC.2